MRRGSVFRRGSGYHPVGRKPSSLEYKSLPLAFLSPILSAPSLPATRPPSPATMQTAMAQKLSLSSAPTAAVRKAGARRLPALRVASTTRCQAVSTLADCHASG